MSGGCKCRPISVKRNVQTEANVVLSKHAASHGLNKNVALPFLTYTYELVSRVVQKYLLYWLWNRAKPSTVHPRIRARRRTVDGSPIPALGRKHENIGMSSGFAVRD